MSSLNSVAEESESDAPELKGVIGAGAVLVQADTRLPASLSSAQRPFVPGWNLLRAWPVESFERTLKESGWRFFVIGTPMSVNASGRSVEGVLKKLIDRIIRTVERRECNCFEITDISVTRALFFSSVRLDAQAHHVQKGSQGTVELGVTPE
jgi:hypothetical protein